VTQKKGSVIDHNRSNEKRNIKKPGSKEERPPLQRKKIDNRREPKSRRKRKREVITSNKGKKKGRRSAEEKSRDRKEKTPLYSTRERIGTGEKTAPHREEGERRGS